MILGKVMNEFRSGKVRTLSALAKKLDITIEELKSILDILVASGKLKRTKQALSGKTEDESACGGCVSCSSGCSGCSSSSMSKSSKEMAEKNAISFYEIAQ